MVKTYENKIFLIFLLFPFIYPTGLDDFRVLKYLFIAWEVVAIFAIVILYLRNYPRKSFINWLVLFQGLMIVITVLQIGGIGDGLKKLFVFPFSCVLCELWSRKNPKLLLRTTIVILFYEQVFNLLLWNAGIFMSGHCLLGIRTDLPIVGFLSIFVAILCLYYRIPNTKFYAWVSIALSIFSIFYSWVSTGIGGLLILFAFLLLLQTGRLERFINLCDNKKLIPIGILINVAIVFLGAQTYFSRFITEVVGESMTLNGRTFIWESAFEYIEKKPLLGYGVYGVYVPVQWGTAYNYVHTQSLQLLLDGGWILLIAFLLLIFSVAKGIDSNNDYYVKKVSTIMLFCCLIMMVTEVFTNYCWFWYLLAMLAVTPNLTLGCKND